MTNNEFNAKIKFIYRWIRIFYFQRNTSSSVTEKNQTGIAIMPIYTCISSFIALFTNQVLK